MLIYLSQIHRISRALVVLRGLTEILDTMTRSCNIPIAIHRKKGEKLPPNPLENLRRLRRCYPR